MKLRFTAARPRRSVLSMGVILACLWSVVGASVVLAAAPANDLRKHATHISGFVPYNGGMDTTEATSAGEPTPTCSTNVGKTIWYRFRAPIAMRLTVDTQSSSFDTVLQVYVATSGGLSAVKCNDDFSGIGPSLVSFNAAAGKLYYFQVGGFNGASGSARFNLLGVPLNDGFAKAAVVGALPFSYEEDTSYTWYQVGEPAPCGTLGKTVWFRYSPASTGMVSADTFGSHPDFDTVINVYRGTSLSSLVHVGCSDDAPGTVHSQISWQAVAGRTYYVQVLGFASADFGPLTLTMTRD